MMQQLLFFFFIMRQQTKKKILWKVDLLEFLNWPEMADTQDAILCSLFCFGGQNPSFVLNQRQLVEAIFAGICVCTSAWGAAASLHRDNPLEWAQFLAKMEQDSWHGVERLPFFFFFFIFDHMPESQEASELFVGLSHICTPTFWCRLTVKIFDHDLSWWKPLPKSWVDQRKHAN